MHRWTGALGHFLGGLRKHVAHRLADERRGGGGGGDDDDDDEDDDGEEEGDGNNIVEPDDDTGAAGVGAVSRTRCWLTVVLDCACKAGSCSGFPAACHEIIRMSLSRPAVTAVTM